jgi:hypothetical protein
MDENSFGELFHKNEEEKHERIQNYRIGSK